MLKRVESICDDFGEFESDLTFRRHCRDLVTWAEPGDVAEFDEVALSVGPHPKLPNGGRWVSKHFRARAPSPERRKDYPTKIPKWAEVQLIQWWREDLNEIALICLVEAHRPMVVNWAQKFVGAKRNIIIEYGMLGLRIAANRVRPNRKKKGSMVGWDPAKGRFSTYARGEADRLMREAAAGHRYEAPQYLQDKITEFRAWAKTPIPSEVERECANNPETPISEIEAALGACTFDWEHSHYFCPPRRSKSKPAQLILRPPVVRHVDLRRPTSKHRGGGVFYSLADYLNGTIKSRPVYREYKYSRAGNPHCLYISPTPFGN